MHSLNNFYVSCMTFGCLVCVLSVCVYMWLSACACLWMCLRMYCGTLDSVDRIPASSPTFRVCDPYPALESLAPFACAPPVRAPCPAGIGDYHSHRSASPSRVPNDGSRRQLCPVYPAGDRPHSVPCPANFAASHAAAAPCLTLPECVPFPPWSSPPQRMPKEEEEEERFMCVGVSVWLLYRVFS